MGRPLVNSEAVVYGNLVQGAYAMFKRDRTNLRPEPQPGDIPDPYEFVAWIHMSDFIFGRTEPKFYGFIARNKDTQQDFVLAIRGTEGFTEWWDDASAYLVPFSQVPHVGRVAHGFDKIYSTLKIEQHPLDRRAFAGSRLSRNCRDRLAINWSSCTCAWRKSLRKKRSSSKERAGPNVPNCDRTQPGGGADHSIRDGEQGKAKVRYRDVVYVRLAPRRQYALCARVQPAAHRVVAHRQLLALAPSFRFTSRLFSTMNT